MLTRSRPFKKRIPRRVHSSGFAAELRDLLGLYDMELVFNDEEANDPKDFLTKQEDDSYTINFRPFNWKPRRAKALHPDEVAKLNAEKPAISEDDGPCGSCGLSGKADPRSPSRWCTECFEES